MPVSSKSQIARNTILLYGRTLLLLFVSLFTSRIILKSLGVEDFGTYTAVAGVVTMLSMMTGPLSGAISRFITYELGTGDKEKLKRVFANSMAIQILFSVTAVILIETIGVWFLNTKMNIPEDRMSAANWVLQFSVLSFVFQLLSTPFNAVIIAHEKMSSFAYISFLDGVLKLVVAYLIYVVPTDKLASYSVLLAIEALIIRLIYTFYSKNNFEECNAYKLRIDKDIFLEMFGFAGWSMFGGAAGVIHVQGTNILLNLFGGSVVNAAYGIASQVNSAVTSFVNNFTTAINPVIIKSYASGERDYMLSLVYQGARFSYYLMLFFVVPIFSETEFIVNLWLGQSPKYSVLFIRLLMVNILIDAVSKTMISGVNANGDIREYQIIVGGLLILNLPLSYLALKLAAQVEVVIEISIIISIVALLARMIMGRKLIGISIKHFIKDVILKVSIVTFFAFSVPLLLHHFLPYSTVRFITVLIVGVITCAVSVFAVGCNRNERQLILNKIRMIAGR